MNRRRCLEILLAVGALGAGAGRALIKIITPRRFVKAQKSAPYPGKIITFDVKNIQKCAKWKG